MTENYDYDTQKYCKKCDSNKAKTLFNKNKKTKDGFQNHCRQCQSEYHTKWRTEINREGYNNYMRNYFANNPEKKIAASLRSRLCNVLNGKKDEHLVTYLGCTQDFLCNWLEYQFDKNMNWDNYGTYWVVDHVLPVASFNHENPEDVKKCWNWKNLRPLEKIENIIKKDNIDYSLYDIQLQKADEFIWQSSTL